MFSLAVHNVNVAKTCNIRIGSLMFATCNMYIQNILMLKMMVIYFVCVQVLLMYIVRFHTLQF